MPVRTAVFGGTGFVGSYLVDALLDAGHEPVLLVRPGSEGKIRQAERCLLVPGDIGDAAAVAATLRGCDAAVWLIGILREDPSAGVTFRALQYEAACRVIDAAKAQGVRRLLLMSANGVKPDGTPYQRTKFAAEQYLARSGLEGTVFRPSIIFGDPRGRMEFATQMRDQMIRLPFPAPAFFSGLSPSRGTFSMTPVPVRDVAEAYVRSLEQPVTIGETLLLGGAAKLTWPEVVRTLAAACGRRKLVVPVPVMPVRLAATALGRFRFFPLSRDELTMLMEGNTVSSTRHFDMLGIEPGAFTEESLAYLRH
jgi:uncharacterized protein YbjT (DUF2867 family)